MSEQTTSEQEKTDTIKKWYVVRAISGQEKKVKQYIELEINRLGFVMVKK
jgi:transcription antitermination factor NusG